MNHYVYRINYEESFYIVPDRNARFGRNLRKPGADE